MLKVKKHKQVTTSGSVGNLSVDSNKFKNVMSNVGQYASIANNFTGAITPHKYDNQPYTGQLKEGLYSGLEMIPEVGPIFSVLHGIENIMGEAGWTRKDISHKATERAGFNKADQMLINAGNIIPEATPLGLWLKSLDKKTDSFDSGLTDDALALGASYDSVFKDVDAANELAGKDVFLGQLTSLFDNGNVNRLNKFMGETAGKVNSINEIGRKQKKSNLNLQNAPDLMQLNNTKMFNTDNTRMSLSRNGSKLLSKADARRILASRKYQNGGVIGTDTSVLPEGSLHARLNHLQNDNPDLEETTRKGIPVLDESGQQVAEIERDELVLRLEITNKVEELMKDGSDEAMIECGKLLVSEIIDNTQDNTGQITEEV